MNISLIALVLSNIVPLIGVVFFGWSLFEVMFVYWAENVVVGFWNVVKMATAKPGKSDSRRMIALFICFFIFHYGMFCFVHGVFVFFLFGSDFSGGKLTFQSNPLTLGAILGAAALFVSHGISYFQNYIGKGEYLKPGDLFTAPYARMMVLHVAIVIGGGAVIVLGLPALALALLVVLKIGFDIKSHKKSHSKSDDKSTKKSTKTTASS